MARGRAAVLMAILLVAMPALAQRAPDPTRPAAAERNWLQACVLTALAHPPRAAFGRCAWRIAAVCQGEPGEGLLIARLPALPGRPQSAAICAQVETTLWQQEMERWLLAVTLLAPGTQQEPLRRVQRGFIAYRDAACAMEAALSPPTEAVANRQSCVLEQTALRALELKRLRDEMWLAVGMASLEGD